MMSGMSEMKRLQSVEVACSRAGLRDVLQASERHLDTRHLGQGAALEAEEQMRARA